MVICGGEANNSDLNDVWALDLEQLTWSKLDLVFGNNNAGGGFSSKRFHTISTLSQCRIVSFGGCHSEYQHLNDVHIFDLNSFVESNGAQCAIDCSRVDFSASAPVPSTRWGHAAAVYSDKLYILGGRNNDDINDLHCFDIESKNWSQMPIGHPMPKPRRRHSAVFVSSALMMFGGFDGEFFNDMHLLNFGPDHHPHTRQHQIKS